MCVCVGVFVGKRKTITITLKIQNNNNFENIKASRKKPKNASDRRYGVGGHTGFAQEGPLAIRYSDPTLVCHSAYGLFFVA